MLWKFGKVVKEEVQCIVIEGAITDVEAEDIAW